MLLADNERFKDDIKKYNTAIDGIEDQQLKSQATKLLNDLIHAVKDIDNRHIDMIYARQLPSMGNEIREKITQIRRQLDNKIKKVS
jgi:gas vesicle protein